MFVNQFLAFIKREIYIYCSLFELVGEVCLGGRRSWRAGADCKSVGKRLWGFESLAAHMLGLMKENETQFVRTSLILLKENIL